MQVEGRVAIVTGGGNGIGAAIAEHLVAVGAKVVVADLDGVAAQAVVDGINEAVPGSAIVVAADVSAASDIARIVERAGATFGPVDLYFANAGVFGESGLGESEAGWARAIDVNFLAHVRAAQILVPQWLERGSGYFVSTASAAGLLTQIGMAQYSTTKHAAVGFAEWLAITYGDQGIRVSCLCPMGVDTQLLTNSADADDPVVDLAAAAVVSAAEVLAPAAVALAVLEAVNQERFLILPHPDVLRMFQNKAQDHDRWLAGMQGYLARLSDSPTAGDPAEPA